MGHEGVADVTVYDLAGRRVSTLAHGRFPAGRHQATWNLGAGEGERVPAGVYFCELRAAGSRFCRRLVVTR